MIISVMSPFFKPAWFSRLVLTTTSTAVGCRRRFSGTSPLNNLNRVIFKRNLDVKPYGKLFLESKWLPVHISHTQSLENFIGICIQPDSDESLQQRQWEEGSDFGVKIQKDETENAIYISSNVEQPTGLSRLPMLKVEVPPHFDLNVHTLQGNSVHFSSLQSTNITCCTKDGHVISDGIKCNQLTLLSQSGNVELGGSVLGNVDVRIGGRGHIRADRLQGSQIRLESDAGEITVDAIYANDSIITCKNSNLFLSNVHGNTQVNLEHGNLSIVGLDGTLIATVEQGNIDAQVSRLFQNAQVIVNAKDGHILLKLSEDLVTRLRLQGKDVLVEERVNGHKLNISTDDVITYEGCLNDATFHQDPLIQALAPRGNVSIGIQSWFAKTHLAL